MSMHAMFIGLHRLMPQIRLIVVELSILKAFCQQPTFLNCFNWNKIVCCSHLLEYALFWWKFQQVGNGRPLLLKFLLSDHFDQQQWQRHDTVTLVIFSSEKLWFIVLNPGAAGGVLASAVLLILGHLKTARYTEGTLLLMLSKSQHKTESSTEWWNKAARGKKHIINRRQHRYAVYTGVNPGAFNDKVEQGYGECQRQAGDSLASSDIIFDKSNSKL